MLTYTHTPASEGPRTPDHQITFLHPSPPVAVTSPFQPSVQGGPPSESTDLAPAAVGGPSVTSPSVHTLCPEHLLMKRLCEKTRGKSGPLWRGAPDLLLLLQIQTGSPMRATFHHCLATAAGPSLPSGDRPPNPASRSPDRKSSHEEVSEPQPRSSTRSCNAHRLLKETG